MGISQLQKVSQAEIAELDRVFLKDGKIQPVSWEYIRKVPFRVRQNYCWRHGIYGLITNELVDFVRKHIAGKKAIEIGAGNGTLGRALGIPITDSHLQKELESYYLNLKQMPIAYPDDVERLTALEAIEKYQPDIVVGSWITHKYSGIQHHLGGNIFGVDEIAIMQKVNQYILLGHKKIHEQKPLLKWKGAKVQKLQLPFLMSRKTGKGDALYFFTRKRKL